MEFVGFVVLGLFCSTNAFGPLGQQGAQCALVMLSDGVLSMCVCAFVRVCVCAFVRVCVCVRVWSWCDPLLESGSVVDCVRAGSAGTRARLKPVLYSVSQ